MSSTCHSVLALITVILVLKVPPIPAQAFSTSHQNLEQDLNTRTTRPNVTEPSRSSSPPSETTAPTLTESSAVESATVLHPEATTSVPVLQTTIPFQPTTTKRVLPTTTASGPHTTELVPTQGIFTPPITTPKMFTTGSSISTTQAKEDVFEITSVTQIAPLNRTSTAVSVTKTQSTMTSSTLSSTHIDADVDDKTEEDKGKSQWFWLVTVFICIICMGGVLICIMCVKTRKKRRSENFTSSLRNGGSHKAKKKKGAQMDTWAGPVAFNGDRDCEAGGEEEGNEEATNKEADEADFVLSTFTAKDKEDRKAGEDKVGQEDDSKAAQVPLLSTDKDAEEMLPPPGPIGDGGIEEDDGINFCLTSAV